MLKLSWEEKKTPIAAKLSVADECLLGLILLPSQTRFLDKEIPNEGVEKKYLIVIFKELISYLEPYKVSVTVFLRIIVLVS